MAPANAASGSSSSLFICAATFWCCLAIDSTSPRTTSSDSRSVPISWDPSDLRDSDMSLRAYSSSMDARAVVVGGRAVVSDAPGRSLRRLDREDARTYRRRKNGAHRTSASRCACAQGAAGRRHRPCPRSCWRLRCCHVSIPSPSCADILSKASCVQERATAGPSVVAAGIAPSQCVSKTGRSRGCRKLRISTRIQKGQRVVNETQEIPLWRRARKQQTKSS